jgi:hypothetical protein
MNTFGPFLLVSKRVTKNKRRANTSDGFNEQTPDLSVPRLVSLPPPTPPQAKPTFTRHTFHDTEMSEDSASARALQHYTSMARAEDEENAAQLAWLVSQ